MAEPTTTFQAHEKYALPFAFSENGDTFYTGGFDGTASAWDTTDWIEIVTVQAHDQSVNCGALSAENLLVTGSTDALLRVWTSDLGDQVKSLNGHKKTVAGVACHPSKPLVASASYDTTVRVWNLNQDDSTLVLEGHPGNVTNVEFVNESTLLSGGIGDEIVVWSVDSGQDLSRLGGHGQAVSGIAASGETQVWSVGYNGTVRLWSNDNWLAIMEVELPGEQKPTGIAANQQTGDLAITRDGGVTILNSDGEPIDEHNLPIKGIYNPLWANDGGSLCVGGADGKVRIFR